MRCVGCTANEGRNTISAISNRSDPKKIPKYFKLPRRSTASEKRIGERRALRCSMVAANRSFSAPEPAFPKFVESKVPEPVEGPTVLVEFKASIWLLSWIVLSSLSLISGKNLPISTEACSTDIFFRKRMRLTSGMRKWYTKTKPLPASKNRNNTKRPLGGNHEKYSSPLMSR